MKIYKKFGTVSDRHDFTGLLTPDVVGSVETGGAVWLVN